MKKKKFPLPGYLILEDPLYNKGTAFTSEERHILGLEGLLPDHISTIEEQVKRRYANFRELVTPIGKYNFLNALHNRNTVLFYRFVLEHITEMVPLIYTPTVGAVSTSYSLLYHEQRGLYLSYSNRGKLKQLINNFPQNEVDVIVVTDGERILGLGDLGVGGMAIPVGKLALYTLFGGIEPSRTLPIILDVGTQNQKMLEDPLYIGWRNERIRGPEYDAFLEEFVEAIRARFPHVLLQWEDFAKLNAFPLLLRYRDRLCSFNDDIQGTAAVVLAAVYSAVKLSRSSLKEQRIVVFGGGSAGMGICNQLVAAMVAEGGIDLHEARKRFFVVDRKGLLHDQIQGLTEAQMPFAQAFGQLQTWKAHSQEAISLEETIKHVHPTILIGVSTQAGAFTESMIKEMNKHVKRPVIFPLSNPTSLSEAQPTDLIKWTNGEAIIATGSPFDPVAFDGHLYYIAQCNNVYIFPGVGLGLIATKARHASDQVFIVAARTLSRFSPMLKDPYAPLFPTLDLLRQVTREIGIEVAKTVIQEGHHQHGSIDTVEELIDQTMWYPDYPIYFK